jgi:hypothetical protein
MVLRAALERFGRCPAPHRTAAPRTALCTLQCRTALQSHRPELCHAHADDANAVCLSVCCAVHQFMRGFSWERVTVLYTDTVRTPASSPHRPPACCSCLLRLTPVCRH